MTNMSKRNFLKKLAGVAISGAATTCLLGLGSNAIAGVLSPENATALGKSTRLNKLDTKNQPINKIPGSNDSDDDNDNSNESPDSIGRHHFRRRGRRGRRGRRRFFRRRRS